MIPIQLKLAILWIALMLTYFLGDVLRIFSGDVAKMDKSIKNMGQAGWFGISILMLMPILMVVLSIFLPDQINRILNIVMAFFFFVFNLFGLPSYISLYDKFLIVVGLVFNIITIIVAWQWV